MSKRTGERQKLGARIVGSVHLLAVFRGCRWSVADLLLLER